MEVNCTESFPLVRLPWFDTAKYSCTFSLNQDMKTQGAIFREASTFIVRIG